MPGKGFSVLPYCLRPGTIFFGYGYCVLFYTWSYYMLRNKRLSHKFLQHSTCSLGLSVDNRISTTGNIMWRLNELRLLLVCQVAHSTNNNTLDIAGELSRFVQTVAGFPLHLQSYQPVIWYTIIMLSLSRSAIILYRSRDHQFGRQPISSSCLICIVSNNYRAGLRQTLRTASTTRAYGTLRSTSA